MRAVALTEVLNCAAAAAVRQRRSWGVAAQAVGPRRQAATGPRYAGGGVTRSAAHPLHGQHRVRLGGMCTGGEVEVDGCRGDDPST